MTRAHITESLASCPWAASGRLQAVTTGRSRPKADWPELVYKLSLTLRVSTKAGAIQPLVS